MASESYSEIGERIYFILFTTKLSETQNFCLSEKMKSLGIYLSNLLEDRRIVWLPFSFWSRKHGALNQRRDATVDENG